MTIISNRPKRRAAAANPPVAKPKRADKEGALKGIILTLEHEEQKAMQSSMGNIYGVKDRVIKMYKTMYPWLDRHHIDYYRRKQRIPKLVSVATTTSEVSSIEMPSIETTDTSASTEETAPASQSKGGAFQGIIQ